MTTKHEYSDSHTAPDKPKQYDAGFWEVGTTKNLMWQLEQQLIARQLRQIGSDQSVLDFACGTGRILSMMSDKFLDVTGVDISAPMAELAKSRCPNATVIVGDIVGNPDLLPKKYDLISSFRFFLNAEPELRQDVLKSLRGALNPGGQLLLNFHLNPSSATGLYLRARSILTKKNALMLSVRDAHSLLEDQGFEVLSTQGYGFLPKHRKRPRWPAAAMWIEQNLMQLPIPAEAANSFIVTARISEK